MHAIQKLLLAYKRNDAGPAAALSVGRRRRATGRCRDAAHMGTRQPGVLEFSGAGVEEDGGELPGAVL
jgi:hypothetical protein